MPSGISKACRAKCSIALSDAVLRDDLETDNPDNHEDPEIMVTRAEAQAREDQKSVGTKKSSKAIFSKRNYAKALHRQADILHHRGNYETALVLYHRAARTYPREASHSVAARRTALAISSATNPSRALRKVLSRAKSACQVAAHFCPETVALRAQKIVEESSDPISSISQILRYFDSRKDFWRDYFTPRDLQATGLHSRSNIMLRRLNQLAGASLRDLQAVFASGDFNKSLKIGNDLLDIAEALSNRYRYQLAARHYLAMTQIALGRHDRAVDQVSRMVRLSSESGDVVLQSRSFMTLGRVHLSYGHLDAAARAWERLVVNVDEAVPKAWLLHEIGRCYFEMKSYTKALETAGRCIEYADESNSRKWLLHGKLLKAQALIELGRYGEAIGPLREAASAATNEKDSDTHDYVSNLIDQVTAALHKIICSDRRDDWNAISNDGDVLKVKSDETINCAEQIYWPKQNEDIKLLGTSDSIGNSEIVDNGSFTRKITIPQCSMMEHSMVKGRRERQNIARSKIGRSSISPSAKITFDLGNSEKQDINPTGPATLRIPSSKRYPHVADLSSHSRYDDGETGGDQVTRGSRIIRTETPKDGNSRDELPGLDGSEIVAYGNETSGPEEQQSDRTGKTYVLITESQKLDIEQSFADEVADNLEFYIENRFYKKREIICDVNNSNNDEYLWDAATNDLAISPERACLYSKGIDDKEEEEKKVNEKDKASPLNHRDVFSSCGSKLSAASTGKTYVVDENRTPSSRYGDYGKTSRSEEICDSPYAFSSSENHVQHHFDNKVGRDTIETMRDSSEDNEVVEYINSKRVAKHLSNEFSTENEEKFDGSPPTRFSIVRCEMDFHEIPGSPHHHLATGESISGPRSYGIVHAAGQHSLYRHALTLSPRKDLPPRFHTCDSIQSNR